MRIQVRAHPGASRERAEWRAGTLHVWVTARAVEGQANRALVQAVARALDVRASAVTLVAGERGRDKVFEVENAGPTAGSPGRS
jgi:uncharacterized protein YggU (UPF0235/DUF167 family)